MNIYIFYCVFFWYLTFCFKGAMHFCITKYGLAKKFSINTYMCYNLCLCIFAKDNGYCIYGKQKAVGQE